MLAFCLGLLGFGLGGGGWGERNEVPALCPRKDLWTACKAKLVIMVPLMDMPCPSHGRQYVCVCTCLCVRACKVSPALVEVPCDLVLILDSLQSSITSLPHSCL